MPIPNNRVYLSNALVAGGAIKFLPDAFADFTPLSAGAPATPWLGSTTDIDGDGRADLLLGAAASDVAGLDAGRVYVALSSLTGAGGSLGLNSAYALVIDGAAAGDHAGISLAGLNDVNGDGRGDLVIGASGVDTPAGIDAGEAYVVFGRGPGSVNLADVRAGVGGYAIRGEAAGDAAGSVVVSLGDINGDGRGDFLIGAPGNDAGGALDAGAAYVVWGKADGAAVDLTAVAAGVGGFKITDGKRGDAIGAVLGVVGDMNGDGISEILIGSPNSGSGKIKGGATFVVFGKADGAAVDLNAIAAGKGGGFVINGVVGDSIAPAVSGIGDINGDGLADMLVTAPKADHAYVVFGKAGTSAIELGNVRNGVGGFEIVPEALKDLDQMSIAGGKDLNGDGIADFVIGAPRASSDGTTTGAVYVVWGGNTGKVDLSLVAQSIGGAKIAGTPDSLTGSSVAIVDDQNGDGRADLLIGAPGTAQGAYLLYSPATWQPDINIYGTNAADVIGVGYGSGVHKVGDGADNVVALGGNDSIATGAGDDTLDGGTGADTMAGGTGNDVYWVDNVGDVVIEAAGDGLDTVNTTVSLTLADNVENLVLQTAGLSVIGNALDNHITGSAGNDVIDGGAGADLMEGGAGDDVYVVDTVADIVREAAGGGTDTVRTTVSLTLADNVENLELLGAGLTGTGNALDNRITGSAGNDEIDGGLGADTMTGGAGDDTYHIDNAGDRVIEAAGAGIDTVIASVDTQLAANVEDLVLTGAAHTGIGNALDNHITGTSGADTLDGGAGADTLAGGAGDDTYKVDNAADLVVEKAGEGVDTVVASVDYTLAPDSNVENLTLTGSAHHATGNAGDNVLTGGSGNDTLDGGGGSDTLIGGAGDDTYIVHGHGDTIVETIGGGNDTIVASVDFSLADVSGIENLTLTGSAHHAIGNDGDNVLTGTAGADLLEGGLGNDTLIGGAGGDSMIGGAGDDTYVIDSPDDVVVETADGGIDTVVVSSDWQLADNIENVRLSGSGHTLVGNAGDNTLSGDTGNDVLDGDAGNDIELGGDGNDTLISTSGTDILAGGSGDDVYKIHGGSARIEDFQGHDTIDASEAQGDSHIDLSGETQTEIEGHDVSFGAGGTVTGALNVQFLQDLTGSFADDIANVRGLVPQIVAALDGVSGGAAFGVSSFRDKAYASFGGFGDYVYQTDLAIGATAQTLSQTYSGFIATGGADLPEAQLEALLQTAVRADGEVGYQSNAARFVVLFTDAPFHTAADGTAAGITVANNGDAIINNGGILENYPELAQLASAMAAANIIPIFAVTPGLESNYQGLADALGRGTVVTLSPDSANIVSAITTGLTAATFTHIADAVGGAGNDTLIGSAAANMLDGGAGDDTLTGGAGDDTLHGGAGSDTATFTGAITDYVIHHNADGTVTVSGPDGTDTLDGIQFLQFGADVYTIRGTPVSGVDAAPVITSDGGADTASVSVAENTTHVTQVTGSDADPATVLTYAIEGGADADKFAIDTATGTLTFIAAPDFEAPTDAGQDNVYDVIVSASDGSLLATQAIAVTVTDVADGNATAHIAGTAAGAVAEDGALSASGQLTVTDPNAGESVFAAIDPALLVGQEGAFAFDPATGAWSYTLDNAAAQALSVGETVTETLTVTSFDGSASQTISVVVTGENDLATISGTATGAVAEAGGVANGAPGMAQASGTLAVQDADHGEAAFSPSTGGAGTYGTFAFDAATGAWTYTLDDSRAATQALASGQTATDKLVVTSLDGSASTTVEVTVQGADDAGSITGTATGAVREDSAALASGTLAIVDPDSTHVFATPAALAGTYGSFTFDTATGAWTYALDNARAATQALAGGQVATETLTVGTQSGDASQTITLQVTGVNDAAVIGGALSGSVTEAVGTTVVSQVSGALTISDIDSPAQFVAGTFAGAHGSATLDAAGHWTYSLNNADAVVDALAQGQLLSDSVTVHAVDGTTRAISLTIVGVNDPINGTSGVDTLNGTAGADIMFGLAGNDRLFGNDGNDVLDGGADDDIIDGGAGIDTVSYASSTGSVKVDLSIVAQQGTGSWGKDTIANVENLTGSAFADTLSGNAGANVIDGGAGTDKITGGGGADVLTGGSANDTFVYLSTSDSTSTAWDTIRDFTHLADRIDLSVIDAVPGKGDNAFIWGGTVATANGAWYSLDAANNTTHIFADTDGNIATAELRIDLAGLVTLTAGDFLL